ncbi:MAG: 2OG-Fe(II) oxygenase [Bacteroidia bacterium]
MEKNFETLISSFIKNQVGISDHFLSPELSAHLKENMLVLERQQLMWSAGTGNAEKHVHDKEVRSDSIYWLDKSHENKHENEFFDLIEDFIRYLNHSCYAGIKGYEFHYSLYENGSFYKKHLDQFSNNSGRKYSLISYLNSEWQQGDGGELLIHHAGNEQSIDPTNGRTVFFKSDELEHEVLVTNERRMSVTGWLKG